MTKARNYPLLFAKGLAMGAADVVPGVSGGTIAFISGIYDELVDSIKAINPTALKLLFTQGVAACWRHINGTFLVVLLAGIGTSVFSLAKLVMYLLATQPLLIWSFFFGLIVASIFYVGQQQRHWRLPQIVALVAGALIALGCAFSPPVAVTATPVTLFLSGMLAICAMILPGISGSFILLLIGVYPVVIQAVSDLNLSVLVFFAAGAACGLLAFSHLLSWLLHHQRATTLSMLIGFLVGSLAVVWPWKVVGGVGITPQLLSPATYAAHYGSAQVLQVVAVMIFGLCLVLGLEAAGGYLARQRRL